MHHIHHRDNLMRNTIRTTMIALALVVESMTEIYSQILKTSSIETRQPT